MCLILVYFVFLAYKTYVLNTSIPKLNLCENKEEKNELIDFLKTNRYTKRLSKEERRNCRRKACRFVMVFASEIKIHIKVVFPFESFYEDPVYTVIFS